MIPARECPNSAVTGRLNGLPASLSCWGVRINHHLSTVTGEMSGGQHRVDEVTRAQRVGCNRKDKSTIAGESSARAKGVTAQMGMGVRTKKNRINPP